MTPKVINLAVRCSLGCGIAITAATACHAQWVSVTQGGGVHVRAPFVRVDVYPHGGVSVRAPFTRVDTPGRPSYQVEHREFVEPITLPPEWSSADELALMDDEVLRQTLRSYAARLHRDLGRFNTAASWQRYLRVPAELLAEPSTEPDKQRDAFAETLNRFHHVATNPDYGMIARLPAFSAMQDVLTEIVSRWEDSAVRRDSSEDLPLPPQNRNSSSD